MVAAPLTSTSPQRQQGRRLLLALRACELSLERYRVPGNAGLERIQVRIEDLEKRDHLRVHRLNARLQRQQHCIECLEDRVNPLHEWIVH